MKSDDSRLDTEKGLYRLRLIDHPQGRKALLGSVAGTPDGDAVIIGFRGSTWENRGKPVKVKVSVLGGDGSTQEFDAGELGESESFKRSLEARKCAE